MAILCLLLGLLSVAGSGSSQDPMTTVGPSKDPTTGANQPSTVATVANTEAGSTAAPVTYTVLNASPSVKVSSAAATAAMAPQPNTVAPPSGTQPAAPSSITSATVPSSMESPTAAEPTTASETVTPTSQTKASLAGDPSTSPPVVSGKPKETGATEAARVIDATQAGTNSSVPPTVPEISPQSPGTETPGDPKTSTPASGSSESPTPKGTSSITTRGLPDVTAKSATPDVPRGSSAVPSTASEFTTREDIRSPETPRTNVIKERENIQVNCTNGTTNEEPLVKIKMRGALICDNNQQTEGGQRMEDVHAVTMEVCKALKPGYQANQDKCIIKLARINDNEVAIADAYIESHLQPKELYIQLKRNSANAALFSYEGADPEDEDVVSIPLISAIVSLAVLLLIIAAAYGCWHQRKARKREQRLTEELQTMENGYHDNPTLEVMETSPEMQEKKGGPNGELGDSWIVPLDNLTREDLEEEEDTHL